MDKAHSRPKTKKVSQFNHMGQTILTDTQNKVLQFLGKQPEFTDFYFTGGTVLSEYYLHHRISEDLDFFSEKEVDPLWLAVLTKKIKKLINADTSDIQQSFNRNLVFFKLNNDLLKTEFTYFPFTQIKKPQVINGLKVDSIIDLAVNKFFTIYQKPSSRHFIDLYLILKEKFVTWDELSNLARNKFDTVIDPIQLGSQLIEAKDISDLPKMVLKLPENEWREYFLDQAVKLRKSIFI